jgi:hypothetical protein
MALSTMCVTAGSLVICISRGRSNSQGHLCRRQACTDPVPHVIHLLLAEIVEQVLRVSELSARTFSHSFASGSSPRRPSRVGDLYSALIQFAGKQAKLGLLDVV